MQLPGFYCLSDLARSGWHFQTALYCSDGFDILERDKGLIMEKILLCAGESKINHRQRWVKK